MSSPAAAGATLSRLDDGTRALVRLSATLAAGSEEAVRAELQRAAKASRHEWIEEVLLQTYLFAGFPRALNGMREWRRIHQSPLGRDSAVDARRVREQGEATCARVYGDMYERLRENVRALHPLLDEWMILEGYGKVLSRPELDLARRELCIVAACAAMGQDRQLQSHLHGARNVGVPAEVVGETLDVIRDLLAPAVYSRAKRFWERIRNDVH